ncbi:MAG: hypothetical protein ACJ0FR_04940 [Gammaproteobacteria bacterium]|tara:strand:+ start:98 stop:781 length:684 start_codon:yes stop_codon:yes gene_type:complete
MTYKIPIFLFLFAYNLNAYQLAPYEAKYKFESKEITITGIREFKKDQDNYEIRFEASNLLASLFFSSKFIINDDMVQSKTYDVKIRPRFLKKDQSITFDRQQGFIKSSGHTSWDFRIDDSDLLLDPLNVQIMIRIFIKNGVNEFDLNIIDMENGGSKTYTYTVTSNEKCAVSKTEYNCIILERYRIDSDRVVKYYLAKELDFMFIKIIDSSPDKINKLELKEVLSFG